MAKSKSKSAKTSSSAKKGSARTARAKPQPKAAAKSKKKVAAAPKESPSKPRLAQLTQGILTRSSKTSKGNGKTQTSSVTTAAVIMKPLSVPEDEDRQPLTIEQLRKVKTDLTKKDLQHYRQLLLEKRAELLGDVAVLESNARGNDSGGNLSHMPLHMADVGSDNYQQEFTLGLVESERKLLREIDEALIRIENGTFGVCLERGVPIARPRLDAKPWARYCIEVAREKERRGVPV